MSVRRVHPDALAAIERFAMCQFSLEELYRLVRDKLPSAYHHNEKMRMVNLNCLCPEPTVRITREHIENALEKRRCNQISERQLNDWATMILINDAYFWEPEDAEVVAEWVDRISLDLIPED